MVSSIEISVPTVLTASNYDSFFQKLQLTGTQIHAIRASFEADEFILENAIKRQFGISDMNL